ARSRQPSSSAPRPSSPTSPASTESSRSAHARNSAHTAQSSHADDRVRARGSAAEAAAAQVEAAAGQGAVAGGREAVMGELHSERFVDLSAVCSNPARSLRASPLNASSCPGRRSEPSRVSAWAGAPFFAGQDRLRRLDRVPAGAAVRLDQGADAGVADGLEDAPPVDGEAVQCVSSRLGAEWVSRLERAAKSRPDSARSASFRSGCRRIRRPSRPHPDIEQHEVWGVSQRPLEAAPPICSRQRLEPGKLEVERAEHPSRRVVVDDEHARAPCLHPDHAMTVDLFLLASHFQASTGTHLATRYAVSPSHISADLTADWSNHRSTVSMTPMTVGPVPRSSRTSTSGRPPSNETRSAPKAKLSRLASAFALPTSPTTKRISIADLLDRKLA